MTSHPHPQFAETINHELNSENEINQDKLIQHLQNRISELRTDNMRLRDNQQSKFMSSLYNEVNIFVSKESFSKFSVYI